MTQSIKNKPLNVAVTGALTPVGREVLNLLADRDFPLDEVYAVETGGVVGEQVSFGEDEVLDVRKLDDFDFGQTALILHAGSQRDAAKIMKLAVGNKATMIDLSGVFAHDGDVPLIIAGVNDDDMPKNLLKNVVAVPSTPATILATALKPLNDSFKAKRVVATIFEPAAMFGRPAMDELFNQTKAMFMNAETRNEYYPKPIAFNVIPMVGEDREDGYTQAEFQTGLELGRMYDDLGVAVTHTAVPVFTGMGMSVALECEGEITAIKAAMQMTGQTGIGVVDDDADLPTPSEVSGEDLIYIARMRKDASVKNGIQFWISADSIRQGTALNAVKVAEILAE